MTEADYTKDLFRSVIQTFPPNKWISNYIAEFRMGEETFKVAWSEDYDNPVVYWRGRKWKL